jgi:hypothetical protein
VGRLLAGWPPIAASRSNAWCQIKLRCLKTSNVSSEKYAHEAYGSVGAWEKVASGSMRLAQPSSMENPQASVPVLSSTTSFGIFPLRSVKTACLTCLECNFLFGRCLFPCSLFLLAKGKKKGSKKNRPKPGFEPGTSHISATK